MGERGGLLLYYCLIGSNISSGNLCIYFVVQVPYSRNSLTYKVAVWKELLGDTDHVQVGSSLLSNGIRQAKVYTPFLGYELLRKKLR